MRCGSEEPRWLVTGTYAPGTAGPGRVLLYGDRCRLAGDGSLLVAVPLTLLSLDPEALVLRLYESGYTESDPPQVAEMLGLSTQWASRAAGAIRSQNP